MTVNCIFILVFGNLFVFVVEPVYYSLVFPSSVKRLSVKQEKITAIINF